MGVRIVVADNEPIEVALKRLKKQLERNGFIWEVRRHAHFIKGTEIRRKKEFQKWFRSLNATRRAKQRGEQ